MEVQSDCPRAQRYLREYGDLLTLKDVAEIFRYPSIQAVRKAHVRGFLPVSLFKLPHRRELFASTLAAVAILNERCDSVTEVDAAGQTRTEEDIMK